MTYVQFKDVATVTPSTSDYVPLSQGGNTRKTTVSDIRGVVNDLTIGGTDKALSAEQGKNLNNDYKSISATNDIATDANNCGTVGKKTVFRTNLDTLNTPYKAGITSTQSAIIETYLSSSSYGVQTYYTSGGDRIFIRSLANGTWGSWKQSLYKSRYSLDGLSITDSNFSATDFATNIATLYDSIDSYTKITIYCNTAEPKYSNLADSITAKLLADLGVTFTSANGFMLELTKNSNKDIPNKIMIFPNNSDRIFYINYDNTVRTAKELTISDSGWITLPLGTVTASTIAPVYRKIGNGVFLKGNFLNVSADSTTIGTLPSGYRPPETRAFLISLNGAYVAKITINTSGVITLISMSTTHSTDYIYYLDMVSFLVD